MFQVERAVFLAAGLGSRLAPVTNTLPKPLVSVNGSPIIVRMLDAVLAAGIAEIHIVRGYLGEKFNALLDKYPMIHFIENADYREANNISSIVAAGAYLENAYVIESDLLLMNPTLITREQERTNYLAIPVRQTDDWCFHTNATGRITDIGIGGTDCEQLVGISYWTAQDGKLLAERARELYARENMRGLYWDEIALKYCKDDFAVYTRRCAFDDITEIDTLAELAAIDKTYQSMLGTATL